jgi:hypothetical protein
MSSSGYGIFALKMQNFLATGLHCPTMENRLMTNGENRPMQTTGVIPIFGLLRLVGMTAIHHSDKL